MSEEPVTIQHIIKEFIGDAKNLILLSHKNEILIKTYVTKLINVLTPIHQFYLPYQRQIDEHRVAQIKDAQEREYAESNAYSITTTIITLGFCAKMIKDDNPYGIGIVDGQHRMAVLRELQRFRPESLINEEIIVKIYNSPDSGKLYDYFVAINKNWEPVPLYNLNVQIRTVVDIVIHWMETTYDSYYFKDIRAPHEGETHRPFMKLASIRDALSNCSLLSDIVNENADDTDKIGAIIIEKISSYNRQVLAKMNPEDFATNENDGLTCRKAHTKIIERSESKKTTPLYLGMIRYYNWIQRALEHTPQKPKKLTIQRK